MPDDDDDDDDVVDDDDDDDDDDDGGWLVQEGWFASGLQGRSLPPCHQGLYDSGGGLSQGTTLHYCNTIGQG